VINYLLPATANHYVHVEKCRKVWVHDKLTRVKPVYDPDLVNAQFNFKARDFNQLGK